MGTFTINSAAASAPKPNSITGLAFQDTNTDGQRAGGEPLIQGVQVNLMEDVSGFIASATTNINGVYSFDDVIPGSYYIDVISFPIEYSGITTKDVGDDATDNDIDPITERSDSVAMSSGLQFIIDIGLILG